MPRQLKRHLNLCAKRIRVGPSVQSSTFVLQCGKQCMAGGLITYNNENTAEVGHTDRRCTRGKR